MHAGHLHIEGRTMSKSKKNFITIKDALDLFTNREIRMLFLLHKYYEPMDYSTESMDNARDIVKKFSDFFLNMKVIIR
jgi:cysteinyl-tRNA synthetase